MIKAIIFDWIGTLYDRNKGVYPFSENVLKQLRIKYKLGLVSIAKLGVEIRKKQIKESGLLPYFDSVVVDKVKTKKEYLKCMDEMGVTPEDVAIVDDRTVRGIKAGNELGCKTFWIETGEYANVPPTEETGEPNYKIDSIRDLLNILDIKK